MIFTGSDYALASELRKGKLAAPMFEIESEEALIVANALKTLLSTKHLYQSVTVPSMNWVEWVWIPFFGIGGGTMAIARTEIPESQSPAKSPAIKFLLPTAKTYCDNCKESWPFAPLVNGSFFSVEPTGHEQFHLNYECQECKSAKVVFMVSRFRDKLQLTGRNPIEAIPAPKFLPNDPAKYYSNAIIAYHAGQTLAGLFLLRVFVEQFWKTIPAVTLLLDADPRATGEKQGDAYQSTLPADFKSRFPSLKDVYGKLSEAMHSANGDAAIFDSANEAILKHFEARKLFKL
jgi:hypothetical protein